MGNLRGLAACLRTLQDYGQGFSIVEGTAEEHRPSPNGPGLSVTDARRDGQATALKP